LDTYDVLITENERLREALREIEKRKGACQWPLSGKTRTPCFEVGVNHPWKCEFCIAAEALKEAPARPAENTRLREALRRCGEAIKPLKSSHVIRKTIDGIVKEALK